MLKQVDHLFHFTKDMASTKDIFKFGFKPSYAKEKLDNKNIIVPMVSFSNILMRDVGTDEVIFYGDFAVCFERQWGIANKIDPVIYSYEQGLLHSALNTFLFSSIFLKHIQTYKKYLKIFSEKNYGPFSKRISLSNTPKEVMDILDYLSTKYDENLLIVFSNYARMIYDTNLPILTLAKPYKVVSAKGQEFIAYNDREWRKLYPQLPIYFEGDLEYEEWDKKPKPHFDQDEYLLKFSIEDVKAVLVKDSKDIADLTEYLYKLFGRSTIEELVVKKRIIIDTKENLIKCGF